MLILPTVPLEYQVAGSPVPLAPGRRCWCTLFCSGACRSGVAAVTG
ncbi:MAG: hypothetical protein L6W00_18430 [Lentisphaeria bacterium]|nr:MAG: hypothetical protein L6W00_18430 [Lentisphaeria bacterium]